MNRRSFLAGLAALGAATLVPFRAAEATELQVEQAWAQLQEEPCWFDVCDRTILVPGDWSQWPRTRRDVYDDVTGASFDSPSDVEDCVGGCPPLESHFQALAEERRGEVEEALEEPGLSPAERRRLRKLLKALRDDPDEGWRAWVRHEGQRGLPQFASVIGDWLADAPGVWESEWFPADTGPQGTALAFFRALDFATLDALGVVIVEGEHPGSTYYAAELRQPTEDANEAAARLHLPIRFREE
jgi:hypothetical protein